MKTATGQKDVTVTFIASPLEAKDFTEEPYEGLPDPSNGVESAGFIEAVYRRLLDQGVQHVGISTRKDLNEALEAKGKPTSRLLVRVKSVIQIAQWLKKYFSVPIGEVYSGPKLRLQIIGHSISGALYLAGVWMADPDPVQAPYYALTSTPVALGSLMQFRGSIVEVRLAGCYVGTWQTNGSPTNGRTLTFALAEIFACKVRGASAEITADKFQKGWLQEPVIGWSWNDAPTADSLQIPKVECDMSKPFVAPKNATVTKGTSNAVKRPLTASELQVLQDYFTGCVEPEQTPKLAVAELQLALDYDGKTVPAMLVCGGLFLAVKDADKMTFYSHPELAPDPKVSALIASINYPAPTY